MSLQNILDPEAVKKDWVNLYAKNLSVSQLEAETQKIVNPNGNSVYEFDEQDLKFTHASDVLQSAPELDFKRARGNLETPTAITNGDVISRFRSAGFDGVSYGGGVSLGVEARENWTPTAKGSSFSIYMTTIGNSVVEEMFRVDDMGIGIGEGRGVTSNGYTLPLLRGISGQVLKLEDNGIVNWSNGSFALQYGGNWNALNDYLVPSGDPNLAINSTLDSLKESICPSDSRIVKITYSTASGDATSQLSLWVNGVQVDTVFLSASQGVFILPTPISVSEGDRIAIRLIAGTLPSQTNLNIFFN